MGQIDQEVQTQVIPVGWVDWVGQKFQVGKVGKKGQESRTGQVGHVGSCVKVWEGGPEGSGEI